MIKNIIFLGDNVAEMGSIIFRTIFFYFFVMLCYRLMGKREVGQLGITDLIVSILIAELIAISIENINKSIFLTIIPIIILVILEIMLAFLSLKSRTIRTFFDGKPSLIIYNGKVNYHEMLKQRYSLDDLLLSLRQKEIKNINEVEYAFLEPNGKLSIFKYKLFNIPSNYPMPLIVDGSVQKKALKKIKKSYTWLIYNLNSNNINIKTVFYAYYKNKKLFVITKNDNEKTIIN
jgi:uncharacterized membrane protein YcaP (DUF421 family)